jgi:hypothetical protein
MDDQDMGVALSVTSLVMALAQDNPDSYKGSYVKAAHRMKKILVDQEYSADYLYYKVPCPWLQVKLLRLLQYFPPSGKFDFHHHGIRMLIPNSRGHTCPRSYQRVSADHSQSCDGNA